ATLTGTFRREPRSGIEAVQLAKLKDHLKDVQLVNKRDRWAWSLNGSVDFFVASIRRLLDDIRLLEVSSQTRWIKAVPIKVNILAWKVRLNGLPSRVNISRRGIDINSILCPICEREVESVSRVFFSCYVAKDNFKKVCHWWNVDFAEVSSYDEWLLWISSLRIHGKHKKVFEGVCYGLWWHLWFFRNKWMFGQDRPSMERLFDDVVLRTFIRFDTVVSFEGPSDTKENRIIDLKLEYQTFKGMRNEIILRLLTLSISMGVNNYSSVSKGFQPKFTPKLIQSSSNSNSQVDPKFEKDYNDEYKKMKAKFALLEASPSKVSDEEEVTQVKVLIALADDELTVRKNHARNSERVDITIRKEKKINEKRLTSSKKVSQCISEQILHQKKKVLGGKLFTESSSKMNENENLFVPASMGILYCMICKRKDHRTSDHEMYIAYLKRSENYKARPYQYASSSKQIPKAKAKPFPPCTHCSFNDHIPDDCINYPKSGICVSYDHSTSGHNHIIQIRGRVLVESSQSNESSIGVKCNTRGSTIHSTTDRNEFDRFKRETHQGAHLVPGQWMLKEYDWCQELSAQTCRATMF
nr:RNA-directed DNA polymerase, eukaryota [Tanacetum cinerariifolium]